MLERRRVVLERTLGCKLNFFCLTVILVTLFTSVYTALKLVDDASKKRSDPAQMMASSIATCNKSCEGTYQRLADDDDVFRCHNQADHNSTPDGPIRQSHCAPLFYYVSCLPYTPANASLRISCPATWCFIDARRI